jgi:glucose-6-phosphate isomerase
MSSDQNFNTLIERARHEMPGQGTDMASQLADTSRRQRLTFALDDFGVDFSRQTITSEGLDLLLELAHCREIEARRDEMFQGEVINRSEMRPVLHTHLRDPENPMARANVDAMAEICARILALGVEDVVSIGIGGSDLGPAMVVDALVPFHQGPEVHFVSNVDPSHLGDVLGQLNPATTAVIAISKTFTTLETMANLKLARDWLKRGGGVPEEQIFAVTSNKAAALEQNISPSSMLMMDEGIGGRFSLWSAVGVGIMLAIGREGFVDMLAGAEKMDRHFATASPESNLPLLAGLFRFWNTAVLERPGQAIIPYDQRLHRLPAWMQQLEMESNGKSLDANNNPVEYLTAPLIFGEPGSNAQHSFFQYLHQGRVITPTDLLGPCRPISLMGQDDPAIEGQHRLLVIQMLAQADALSLGKPEQGFPGGRPVTLLTWDETSPFSLGRLLAYYEHITAVLGWMLGLNSFDQPGVELGKIIARNYQNYLEKGDGVETIPAHSLSFLERFISSD